MPVREFTQIGKNGKTLQQTAVGAKSCMKNQGRDFGTFGKEAFRRGRGTVKRIAVQVDGRKHGTVLMQRVMKVYAAEERKVTLGKKNI